jgi:hypothetical protein
VTGRSGRAPVLLPALVPLVRHSSSFQLLASAPFNGPKISELLTREQYARLEDEAPLDAVVANAIADNTRPCQVMANKHTKKHKLITVAEGRWSTDLGFDGPTQKACPVAGLSRPMDKPVAKCGISVADGPGLAWATKKAYPARR